MPFIYIYGDEDFDEEDDAVDDRRPDLFSYEKPELGDDSGRAKLLDDQGAGVLDRLKGKAVPSYLKLSAQDKDVLKAFLPALKEAGIRRLHLSYDGGSDEGFGTLDRCEDASGAEIAKSALLENEAFVDALGPFVMEGFNANRHLVFLGNQTPEPSRLIDDCLDHELPVILVSLLVGRGYGTGEYELYGRAVADLDTMTITDDPNAPWPHGASD